MQSSHGGQTDPQVVRAQKFIVTDDEGRAVGEFGFDQGSVRLRIPSEKGETGVTVGVFRDGNRGVVLFDQRGEALAELSIRTDRSQPTLWLGDRNLPVAKRPRAILYAEADGASGLVLYDKDGTAVWRAP